MQSLNTQCTLYQIQYKLAYLIETSWLHFDCSIRIFDCSNRVYQCIFELVPINAYSYMKSAQAPPAMLGNKSTHDHLSQLVT